MFANIQNIINRSLKVKIVNIMKVIMTVIKEQHRNTQINTKSV